MRELHGFTTFLDPSLKHEILIFDRLAVHGAGMYLAMRYQNELSTTLSFLGKHGIVLELPDYAFHKYEPFMDHYMKTLPTGAGLPEVEDLMNFVTRCVASALAASQVRA
jgi:hypothetical protein